MISSLKAIKDSVVAFSKTVEDSRSGAPEAVQEAVDVRGSFICVFAHVSPLSALPVLSS